MLSALTANTAMGFLIGLQGTITSRVAHIELFLQGMEFSNAFQIHEDKPPVFSVPFTQAKAVAPAPAPALNLSPQSFIFSGLGLPEVGQRTINDLMTFYDANLNRNKGSNLRNVGVIEDLNNIQPGVNYYIGGVGIVGGLGGGHIFDEVANGSLNQTTFTREETHFDQKVFDQLLESNQNDVASKFRFGSPFNLSSVDHSEELPRGTGDALPKHDNNSGCFL